VWPLLEGAAAYTGQVNPGFDIRAEWLTKDPEWAVTYKEWDSQGAARTCRFSLYPGQLAVGSLAEWDSPRSPIDSEARERILDRVFTWALSSAPVQVDLITGDAGAEAPLRVRNGFHLEIAGGTNRRHFLYQEAGRSVEIPSRALVPEGRRPCARIYPARVHAWRPSGEPLSEEDRARIVQRIEQDGRAAVEADSSANQDAWSLAQRLLDWDAALMAIVPDPGVITAVLRGQQPPPSQTVFWSLELPALYEASRTGWSHCAPGVLGLAPIAEGGVASVRSWLLGGELPLPPRVEGGVDPHAETRMLTTSWAFARTQGVEPPAEFAQHVLGTVVEYEAGDEAESAALAVYADGRLRYVGPRSVVVCEADVSAEAVSLARALLSAAQAALAHGVNEGSAHAPDTFRASVITLAGNHFIPVLPGDAIERAATAILAALIERTVPI
jgi:hypothetical protein